MCLQSEEWIFLLFTRAASVLIHNNTTFKFKLNRRLDHFTTEGYYFSARFPLRVRPRVTCQAEQEVRV